MAARGRAPACSGPRAASAWAAAAARRRRGLRPTCSPRSAPCARRGPPSAAAPRGAARGLAVRPWRPRRRRGLCGSYFEPPFDVLPLSCCCSDTMLSPTLICFMLTGTLESVGGCLRRSRYCGVLARSMFTRWSPLARETVCVAVSFDRHDPPWSASNRCRSAGMTRRNTTLLHFHD